MEILVSEGMSEGAWPFSSKKLTRKIWSGPTSGESLISDVWLGKDLSIRLTKDGREETTKSAMNVMTAQLYNITTPTFIRPNLQPDCPWW